jgi:hypothetical protein
MTSPYRPTPQNLPVSKRPRTTPFHNGFAAEDKERNGFLDFDAWERLDQTQISPAIRLRALRCHHLYDIKRDNTAKNRVVVNGSRQHSDTYTDTTSPVASQLQLRLFLATSAYRKYTMVQLDLTNAYLHAPIRDVVYIFIPEGFLGQGEIARLRKAAYGTKPRSYSTLALPNAPSNHAFSGTLLMKTNVSSSNIWMILLLPELHGLFQSCKTKCRNILDANLLNPKTSWDWT